MKEFLLILHFITLSTSNAIHTGQYFLFALYINFKHKNPFFIRNIIYWI